MERNLDMLPTLVAGKNEYKCLSDMTTTDLVKTGMAMDDKAHMKSLIIGLSIALKQAGDKFDLARDVETLAYRRRTLKADEQDAVTRCNRKDCVYNYTSGAQDLPSECLLASITVGSDLTCRDFSAMNKCTNKENG